MPNKEWYERKAKEEIGHEIGAGIPQDEQEPKWCPDCGHLTLRLIENTDPNGLGEFKEVRTCDSCKNIVYIVRDIG